MKNIKLSVSNLVPRREGQEDRDVINNMATFTQALDDLGYERYWAAEYHNAPNLVSSATSLLVQHTLEHTHSIKVGSGGIVLPNHAPLVVVEQFGTLEILFPRRVDLGLERAPGTDMMTADALGRDRHNGVYQFPEEVEQLQRYLGPSRQQAHVRTYPAIDKNAPMYTLGSSTGSAHLVTRKGLSYVFAGYFASQQVRGALQIYRELFGPSEVLDKPYVIVCLNTIVSDSDEQTEYLAVAMSQIMVSITRGKAQPVQPSTDDLKALLTPREYELVQRCLEGPLVGSEDTAKQKLELFMKEYGDIDEFMATSYIYDQDKQIESYRRLECTIKS